MFAKIQILEKIKEAIFFTFFSSTNKIHDN